MDKISARESDWTLPIAKSVGACVLVTDDADGFKTVADDVGVQHQVCKAHVLRNTESLIEQYQPLVAKACRWVAEANWASVPPKRKPI